VIASESRDAVTILRLDRPDQRNALVPALLETFVEHLHAAASRKRPVVLTGNGPAFCAGADLRWLANCSDPALGVAQLVAVHHLAVATLFELPVPVIAALTGPVAGGGLGLALVTDYCMAAESASFIAAYGRLGLTPDGGVTAFLERSVGMARARELLLTNRHLSAHEAYTWGLVNAVVADAELLERAITFAAELEPVPGYALLQTRRLLDASYLHNQLQLESVAIRTAAKSEFFRSALEHYREAHPWGSSA
jgi:2-(1,2-epoxy-1,2-dihydrophenyl)acetyl-CoA isomerase